MFTWTRLNIRNTCILPVLFEHHVGHVTQWRHYYNWTWCHQFWWKKKTCPLQDHEEATPLKSNIHPKSIHNVRSYLTDNTEFPITNTNRLTKRHETHKYKGWEKCSFSAKYRHDTEGKCLLTLPSGFEPNKCSCSHKLLLREPSHRGPSDSSALVRCNNGLWTITLTYSVYYYCVFLEVTGILDTA